MFREMRLTRQQLSLEETEAILRMEGTGTLALAGDDGYPYSVPVNYIYLDGCIYFHGAQQGHKCDAIAREPKASMSVIAADTLIPEKYTTDYRSVIAFGEIYPVTDDEKKRSIIRRIGMHFCSAYADGIDAEIDREWNMLNVYEMKITHMTGKRAMV